MGVNNMCTNRIYYWASTACRRNGPLNIICYLLALSDISYIYGSNELAATVPNAVKEGDIFYVVCHCASTHNLCVCLNSEWLTLISFWGTRIFPHSSDIPI